jgi:hypothetical protein
LTVLVLAVDAGSGYVAAAYIVFVVLIVAYVAIMAAKLSRIERALEDHESNRGEPRR